MRTTVCLAWREAVFRYVSLDQSEDVPHTGDAHGTTLNYGTIHQRRVLS
jgi:hypothetical protein